MAFKVASRIKAVLLWHNGETGQDEELIHWFDAAKLRRAGALQTAELVRCGFGSPKDQAIFKKWQDMQNAMALGEEYEDLTEAEDARILAVLPSVTALDDVKIKGYTDSAVKVEGYEGEGGGPIEPADVPPEHQKAALDGALDAIGKADKLVVTPKNSGTSSADSGSTAGEGGTHAPA